jgi:hypothetical protein
MELNHLDDAYKRLKDPDEYPVEFEPWTSEAPERSRAGGQGEGAGRKLTVSNKIVGITKHRYLNDETILLFGLGTAKPDVMLINKPQELRRLK